MTKLEMLSLVREKVCQCTKCPDLVANRTQIVFDNINYDKDSQLPQSGNNNTKLLLLGEAPGQDEDKTGRPFVGKAGKLLDNILAAFGVKREDVYICNILKCRPPNNRRPEPEEAVNCEPFLKMQIKIVNPKIIVCLGSSAVKYLLKIDTPISHIRGKWFEYNDGHVNAQVMPTFHPSYLLRQPSAKEDVAKDMESVMEKLNS